MWFKKKKIHKIKQWNSSFIDSSSIKKIWNLKKVIKCVFFFFFKKSQNKTVELEFYKLEFYEGLDNLILEIKYVKCSVQSERLLCFFQWNLSFIDSSSTGNFVFFFFFVLLYFALLCFAQSSNHSLGIIFFFHFFPGHAGSPETEMCACTECNP